MAECEVCGKTVSHTRKTEIDRTVMNVCDDCVSLGREIFVPKPKLHKGGKPEKMPFFLEGERELVTDFAKRVRIARENMGLNQKDASMKIGISDSVLKRVENGFKPDPDTGRKIERFFRIKLFETREEDLMGMLEK